jgi:hypothetical protein
MNFFLAQAMKCRFVIVSLNDHSDLTNIEKIFFLILIQIDFFLDLSCGEYAEMNIRVMPCDESLLFCCFCDM